MSCEPRRIVAPAVASYSALPEPMLARSGRLPTSGDNAYELKWDGFRAIVSTGGSLRLLSGRGWDMAPSSPASDCEAGTLTECPRDCRTVPSVVWVRLRTARLRRVVDRDVAACREVG
jgi:ATP-dependent DNA ligase